jgi:hypothetical protein
MKFSVGGGYSAGRTADKGSKALWTLVVIAPVFERLKGQNAASTLPVADQKKRCRAHRLDASARMVGPLFFRKCWTRVVRCMEADGDQPQCLEISLDFN